MKEKIAEISFIHVFTILLVVCLRLHRFQLSLNLLY